MTFNAKSIVKTAWYCVAHCFSWCLFLAHWFAPTMEIRVARRRRSKFKAHYPSDFEYIRFVSVGKCWQNRRVNESCVSRGVYTIIVYALTSTMVCVVFILILISFDFVCLLTMILVLLAVCEPECVWGWGYSSSSSLSLFFLKMLLRNVIWLWTKSNMCNHHHRRRRSMYEVHKGWLNLQANPAQRTAAVVVEVLMLMMIYALFGFYLFKILVSTAHLCRARSHYIRTAHILVFFMFTQKRE